MKKIFFTIIGIAGIAFFAAAQGPSLADLSLKKLQNYPYRASPLVITELASQTNEYYAYNFSYTSMGLKVTGRFSLPKQDPSLLKGVVIMLRGHQNAQGYYTGKGTENPARYYMRGSYAVIAPDFLGYAGSAATPQPEEAHQFFSTINAVELYESLLRPAFSYAASVPAASRAALPSSFKKIVLWGHSNGGQVAIHFLEVTKKPVPTVLWAPVSLDFPQSMVNYQRNRAWAETFKKNYPAEDYSLFRFMDSIAPGTPILLEQGTRDYAVPKAWSDAFSKGIEGENNSRQSAEKIALEYKVFEGANHNLNPFWSTIFSGDLAFWDAH
ncbi:MAG: alpha/beta fold hydrolase [Treponema sp.]|nr:alpha/beta fold hydrolase [Treponema sp.]